MDEKSLEKKPKYTLAEELISAISHGIGVFLSIAALVLCVVTAARHGNTIGVVGSCIYGTTLIILYTMSTLYHSFKHGTKVKSVFRIFDHCSIFLLIFGSYTPIVLSAIGGGLGWTMFGILLALTIAGITVNAINLEKYKKVSMFCYLLMGWMVIFTLKPAIDAVTAKGMIILAIGGIIYTLGAIIYGVGKYIKYMHSVWHFFVLGGSIVQFFTILWFVC